MSWKNRATPVKSQSSGMSWKDRAIESDPSALDVVSDPQLAMETGADMAQVAHQAFTLGHSDEIAGGLTAVVDITKGDDIDKTRRDARETRDAIRSRVSASRERSPVATTITELTTPSALDLIPYGGTLSKILRNPITQGAVAGVGYSDEMKDAGIGAGLGSLMGTVGLGVSKGSKRILLGKSNTASELRQATLGRGAREVKERGLFLNEKPDISLEDIGFFQKPSQMAEFDLNKGKFVAKRDAPPKTWTKEQILLDRSKKATNKLSAEVKDTLRSIPNSEVSFQQYIQQPEIQDALMAISLDEVDPARAADLINKEVEAIKNRFLIMRNDKVPLDALSEFKTLFQTQANYARNAEDTNKESIYKHLARGTRQLIERKASDHHPDVGAKVSKLNGYMSNLIPMAQDIEQGIARRKSDQATGGLLSSFGISSGVAAGRTAEQISATPTAGLMRASIGRAWEKNPRTADVIKRVGEQGLFRTMLPQNETDSPLGRFTSLPEMIMKTRIPRDTKSVLENKELLLEKVALAQPMMYKYVEDIVNTQPERIPEILPAIIQMSPDMFESDEYNRVDGKLINPIDKQKALRDTIKRDDISNSEKVAIMDRISAKGMM